MSKKKIRRFIYYEVKKQNSLQNVKKKIKMSNDISRTLDNAYIEKKYIKYCFEFWTHECVEAIVKITEEEMLLELIAMFSDINPVHSLEDVPEPWNDCEYYNIFIKNKNSISNCEEKKYLEAWKTQCLQSIMTALKPLKKQLEFIEAFFNAIITLKKKDIELLQLEDLMVSKLKFINLHGRLSRYLSSNELEKFNNAISHIHLYDNFDLKDLLCNIKTDFDKPIELLEEEVDGRKIIYVYGMNLSMREVIERVENILVKKSDILEVRFIGGYVIHADVDLRKEIWHGKNIVVFTRFLKVHGKVLWNVSGADSNFLYKNPAGTDDHGNGLQGEEGYAGESGGNVLINVDRIDSPNNLQVISNGGMGSPGQDGGPGKNGQNGCGISRDRFMKCFPQVCRVGLPYNKIKSAFREPLKICTQNYCAGCFANYYIEGENLDGFKTTYISRSMFKALLVCEGSRASPPGRGGEFGLGGQGGYAGDVVGINGETKPGGDGANGEGGPYGKPGINGWDMGYLDFLKILGFGSKTKFYGESQDSKLTIYRYPYSGTDHVWCETYKCYVSIKSSKIDKTLEQYNERYTKRISYKRQNQAKAIRKKTISKTKITEDYSKYVSNETEAFRNHKSNINKIEELVELEIQNSLKINQKQTLEITLKRYIDSKGKNKSKLISIGENIVGTDLSEKPPQITDELFNKFEVINKDISSQLHVIDNNMLIDYFPKIIIKSEKKSEENILSLGAIRRFIYEKNVEDYQLIIKYALNQLNNKTNEALKYGVKKYILQNAFTSAVIVYYQEYENFLLNKKTELNRLLKLFVDEFLKPEYNKLRVLLLSCYTSRTNEFDEQLEKNKSNLTDIYNQINECLKDDYNWDACCSDPLILEHLKNDMIKFGIQSKYLREILSYAYNINIRYYAIKENQYFETDCHNPFKESYLHLLYDNERTFEMEVDNDYFELLCRQQKLIAKYKTVLHDFPNLSGDNITCYIEGKCYMTDQFSFEELPEHNNDDDNITEIIKMCSNCRNHEILEQRLRKLTFPFINNSKILLCLSRRFSLEGIQISLEELMYLVNNVLFYAFENQNEHFLISWIVIAHNQKCWLTELLFLKLQRYFRKTLSDRISKWRDVLSKMTCKSLLLLLLVNLDRHNKICVSIENIDEIISYLPEIRESLIMDLEGLGLSEWPHKLKEFAYYQIISNNNVKLSRNDTASLTHFAISISNCIGKTLARELLLILLYKEKEYSNLSYIFYWIQTVCNEVPITTEDINSLQKEPVKTWLDDLMKKYLNYDKERGYSELMKLINTKATGSQNDLNLKTIVNELSKAESSVQSAVRVDKWFTYNTTTDEEILFEIDSVLMKKRKFKLRDSQKLSIMILVKNSDILAQISTGEGKSLIVVAFSIIKALRKEKVHVITSSVVLAERDATENQDIFRKFGVTVGHNCDENIDKRRQSYSNNKVVYGELSYFQRDYLLDKFFGENILGDNIFDNVIIDEVDSMLVDRGNSMLYLSHDIAGFDKLESVYVYIWSCLNRPIKSRTDFSDIFDERKLEQSVLNELYNVVDKNTLKTIDGGLTDSEIESFWLHLIDQEIVDSKGRIIIKEITKEKLNTSLSSEFRKYSERLCFLFRNIIERKRYISVPNFLKAFVELHLKSWIKSAIRALFMKEFENYVIDTDKTGNCSDKNPIVVILDTDTGTDQSSSQWDEALHQFLQLKHGCKLTLQSLKSVYISNVTYFKLYTKKYGVTGTLGSEPEMKLLSDLHGVQLVVIPTSKPKQFIPRNAIICKNIDVWIEEIINEAKTIIVEERRSILIICETVQDVVLLEGKLSEIGKVVTYTRDYEEFEDKRDLKCGVIIIATNLAGRGTDIKLSCELCSQGGLHVCMTYLPESSRVEEQGFGRAARRGERGSGRLIVVSDDYTDITCMKVKSDDAELKRISEIKTYYDNQITTEENYFEQFTHLFECLKKKFVDKNETLKSIILDSCLDKWALWLDGISDHINNIEDSESKFYADKSLKTFLSKYEDLDPKDFRGWVHHNPMRMIALGKFFIDQRDFNISSCLFNEVISREPKFCEAAHYYNALVYRNHKNDIANMKNELKKAEKLLNNHRIQLSIYSDVVSRLKDTRNIGLVQVNAFEEQKENIFQIYSAYLQSIDEILGSPINVDTFSEFGEEAAKLIYKDLISFGLLKKPNICEKIDEDVLKTISNEYCIPFKDLQEFLAQNKGDIEETEFKRKIETSFKFRSKENLWRELIDNGILSNEVQYVSIRKDCIEKYYKDYFDLVDEQNIKSELFEFMNKSCVIFFDEEQMKSDLLDNNCLILENQDLVDIIGNCNCMFLKSKQLLTFNYVGIFDTKTGDENYLKSFDSITVQDFIDANIFYVDAVHILDHLCEKGFLLFIDGTVYRLAAPFSEIDNIDFSLWHLYQETVICLLTECFSYRIIIQELQKSIKNNEKIVLPDLMPKPHQLLYWRLIDEGVIEPAHIQKGKKHLDKFNRYLNFLENRGIGRQHIDEALYDCNSEHDQRLSNDIWSHLEAQGWIEINPDRYHIIKLSNVLTSSESTVKWHSLLEYEEIIRDVLKNRAILSMYIEDLRNTYKKLSVSGICDKKLKIDDSSVICNQLYVSEEMQCLRLSGLNEIITFKTNSLGTFCSATCGIFKMALSVVFYSSSYFKHLSERFTSQLFNSGWEQCKIAMIVECLSWREYLKHKLMVNIRRGFLQTSGFFYAKYSSKASSMAHRIMSQANVTKSLEAESGVNMFFHNLRLRITESMVSNVHDDLINSLLTRIRKFMNPKNREAFEKMLLEYIAKNDKTIKMLNTLVSIRKDILSKLKREVKQKKKHESLESILKTLVFEIEVSSQHCIEFRDNFKNFLNKTIEDFCAGRETSGSASEPPEENKIPDFINDTLRILLEKHLSGPVVVEGQKIIKDIFIKRDLELYKSTFEEYHSESNEELKQRLYDDHKISEVKAQSQTLSLQNVLTNMYRREISKLLERVRNVTCFAGILRENVAIGKIYLDVFVYVIPKLLNLNSLTVCINNNENTSEKYTTDQNSPSQTVINISLVNDKFQLYDNNYIDDFKQFLTYPNNLYDAFNQKHDSIISKDKFGVLVAKCVEENNEVHSILETIWEKLDKPPSADQSSEKCVDLENSKPTPHQPRSNEFYDYEVNDIMYNLKSIVADKISHLQNDDSIDSIEFSVEAVDYMEAVD